MKQFSALGPLAPYYEREVSRRLNDFQRKLFTFPATPPNTPARSSPRNRIGNPVTRPTNTGTSRNIRPRTDASNTMAKRRRVRTGGAVTTQRDATTRYVRKRMPKRRRRRWTRFVRRVRHVELQAQPLGVYQSLTKGSVTTILGLQSTQGVTLKDVAFTSQSDLVNIFKDAYGGTGLVTDYDNRRIYLKSCALDLQIKNIGTEQCVIDVYRIVARKNNSTSYGGLVDFWLDAFGDSTAIGSVSENNPAMTPFDCPSFCKYWLVKSKQEFIITPDQVISMQIRDPRNRMLQGRIMQNSSGGLKGFTEGFLFQVRGVPEATAAASGLTTAAIAWSAQNCYHYAIPPGLTSETIGQSK